MWNSHDSVSSPGTRFTKSLWAHNPNLAKLYFAFTWQIMIWSGHDHTYNIPWHGNSAIVACAKLWPDWIVSSRTRANRFLRYLHYELTNCLCNGSQIIDKYFLFYCLVLMCVSPVRSHTMGWGMTWACRAYDWWDTRQDRVWRGLVWGQ